MKIAIGNDHSAVELKNIIVDFLKEKGIEVLNLGTDSSESCDYPVYGETRALRYVRFIYCNRLKCSGSSKDHFKRT